MSDMYICVPGLYCITKPYFCKRHNMRWSLGGALANGFFTIVSSGLWSDSTITCFPKVYWLNISRANIQLNDSFSICAYLVSVSATEYLLLIGYPWVKQLLSKKDGKDQETIQSSTTPDPGYHMAW